MKQTIKIIVFLILSKFGIGQSYPKVKEIKQIFENNHGDIGYYSWNIDNSDSAFYKNDTLNLFYRNDLSCFTIDSNGAWINWTFVNPKQFYFSLNDGYVHQQKLEKIENNPLFNYKIKKNNDSIFFIIKCVNSAQKMIFKIEKLIVCSGDWVDITGYGYCLILIKVDEIKNYAP